MNAAGLFSLAIDVLAGATIIMLIAWSLSLLMNRFSAASRHFYWTMIITGLLLLPVISLVSPKISVNILPEQPLGSAEESEKPVVASLEDSFTAAVGSISETEFSDSSGARTIAPSVSETQTGNKPDAKRLTISEVLLLIWTLGAFTVGMWILSGWIRLRWMVRRWKDTADPQLQDLCAGIAGELNVKRSFRLMNSERAMMPLVIGLKNAVLILPTGIGQWDLKKQKAVLYHEIGHIQRFDCLTQFASQIFCAIYWFHPLSWLISQKLRSEAEAACDDLAIRSGSEPSEYAEHLLQIAKSFNGHKMLSSYAAPMAGSLKLENRLRLILAAGINRKKLSGFCAMLCTSAAISFTLVFSTIRISADSERELRDTPLNEALSDRDQTGSNDANSAPQSRLLPTSPEPTQDRQFGDTESNLEIPASESCIPKQDSPRKDPRPIRGGGTLESPTVVEVRSELDRPTEILWVVAEGRTVKKGDLILEFESSKLIEELETRQIEIAMDNARIESAKTAVVQTRQDNDSTIATLELNLKLAELNQQKGEAEFELKLKKAENELNISQTRLEGAERNYSVVQKRFKTGQSATEEVKAAELQIEEAKSKLQLAAGEYENLVKHVREYETTAHQLAIQQVESGLQGARAQTRNKVAAAEAELKSLEVVHEIKSRGLNRSKEQIAKCRIYAPLDGMIVYSSPGASRLNRTNNPLLQAGSIARKNQPLIRLHDLSRLQISILVHESQVGNAVIGQPAAIHVDGQPGRSFQGKVTRISKNPDPKVRLSGSGKYYRLAVEIEKPADDLRPGLSGTVELLGGGVSSGRDSSDEATPSADPQADGDDGESTEVPADDQRVLELARAAGVSTAEYLKLKLKVETAQLAVLNSQENLEFKVQLVQKGYTSSSEVEKAKLEVEMAQIHLQAARDNLKGRMEETASPEASK